MINLIDHWIQLFLKFTSQAAKYAGLLDVGRIANVSGRALVWECTLSRDIPISAPTAAKYIVVDIDLNPVLKGN